MNVNLRPMARAGKTFYFAALWLPREIRDDAARAYTFCRAVDDLADESSSPEGRAALAQIERSVASGVGGDPISEVVLPLMRRYPTTRDPLVELVRSCAADGPGIRIETEGELRRYAEGVAGTVGRAMYPLLGGVDPRGLRHAEALGVAMQYTNIARDVLSDLADNRVYLPREWLAGAEIDGLSTGDHRCEEVVVRALRSLLRVADEHYAFGLEGVGYLAPECRRGIEIAARCYGAIGARVIVGGRLERRRAVVPMWHKILVAARVVTSSANTLSAGLAATKSAS